eukprot:1130117-Pyramimonas_sp.AAC.1
MDYIVNHRVWRRDNDQVVPMDVHAVCSWYDKGSADSKGKGKSAKGTVKDDKGKAKGNGTDDKGKSKAAKKDEWCD